MKIKHIVIFLLCFAILLLLTDLITGIWYWNRLNLKFNSANFNNIITPSFTIIATLIYGFALFNTVNQNKIILNQNKIILSQNLKPHYEKEIDILITKSREIKIEGESTNDDKQIKIDALNYIEAINDCIIKLSKNKEYLEDYSKYENNELLNIDYFKSRNYFGNLLFLSQFTIEINSISFFYEDIKILIQEINQSKLITEDKELLKKRIKKNLLSQYISFIEFMDNQPLIVPPIPVLYNFQDKIEFKLLSKTNFRKYFDWFKSELN